MHFSNQIESSYKNGMHSKVQPTTADEQTPDEREDEADPCRVLKEKIESVAQII